jgi:hypothetical protein
MPLYDDSRVKKSRIMFGVRRHHVPRRRMLASTHVLHGNKIAQSLQNVSRLILNYRRLRRNQYLKDGFLERAI